eukprot:260168_1
MLNSPSLSMSPTLPPHNPIHRVAPSFLNAQHEQTNALFLPFDSTINAHHEQPNVAVDSLNTNAQFEQPMAPSQPIDYQRLYLEMKAQRDELDCVEAVSGT